MTALASLITQLDEALNLFSRLDASKGYHDFSDVPTIDVAHFVSRAHGAIDRIAGPTSTYSQEARRQLRPESLAVPHLAGILRALKHDLANGYLARVSAMIHAEVFADYLDMADHLLSSGYKDAAAVLIGGTLETHLRQLAVKHNVPLDVQTAQGTTPKRADVVNADLTKAGAYSKLEQKTITAWLDLRNLAAHGQYVKYSEDNVKLFLAGLRIFLIQFPA